MDHTAAGSGVKLRIDVLVPNNIDEDRPILFDGFEFLTPAALPETLTAFAMGDPHFVGAHGDKFSMRGTHMGTYNLLSAPNTSFGVRIESDHFHAAMSRIDVNGSFARTAFWTLRTPTTGRELHVTFSARQGNHATFRTLVRGEPPSTEATIAYDGGPPFVLEGITVSLRQKALTVDTGTWRMRVKSTKGRPHLHKYRLNVAITNLHDTCASPVAPHGILGQTFDCDDSAVHGRQDNYSVLDDGRANLGRRSLAGRAVVTTRAQAEGAVEGEAADYLQAGPFDVQFAYSRFDLSSARVGPRQAHQMSGVKHDRSEKNRVGSRSSPVPMSVPRA